MTGTWFLCKVRFEKMLENGMQKNVTEPYLVDAISYTEAEARIIKEMEPYISGEFTVSDIRRANYSEVFPSDDMSADKWFEARLEFVTLDERSGSEKKTRIKILVQAADLRDAMKNIEENMKGTMADYNAISIKETAIMDIYPYEPETNKKE